MYILSFSKSRSKNFEKAVDLTESLGGAWDGRQMTLEIPDNQLLDAYEFLMPLFEIIQNWSTTRATFNGADVKPYPFILNMHFVKECAEKSNLEPKNCWLSDDCPGWTCKKLTNILFLESGSGYFKNNDRYWYNFGQFNSKNEWIIDKDRIYERLIRFAETKGLNICPHFNEGEVRNSVDRLRSKIIIDEVNYRVYFTYFYEKGERLKFPENIRHISKKYEGLESRRKSKYDISKIRIILNQRSGDIPEEAKPSPTNPPMKYHLRVYDNYHHGDESEAYDHGAYDTYEEAENAAKAIVKEFLKHNWSRGKAAGMLLAEYGLYGEDPIILPSENPEGKTFSASDYAEEIAETICQEMENKQKNREVQTLYQEAIKFAAARHEEKGQKVKGTELPYVVHLSNVAMEIFAGASKTADFDLNFAVQVALLHDTIEDTETTFAEIEEVFGKDIAIAVLALSKDDKMLKEQQVQDSLTRIKKLRKEVWAVKLADRITNLQPAPADWNDQKRIEYLKDAQMILDELRDGNAYLAKRLKAKISEYRNQNYRFLPDGF